MPPGQRYIMLIRLVNSLLAHETSSATVGFCLTFWGGGGGRGNVDVGI